MTDDNPQCPVCGQEYQHSFEVGSVETAEFSHMPDVRSDVGVCKTGGSVSRMVYVHYDRKRVVSEVRRRAPRESRSGFKGLLGRGDTEEAQEE